MVRIFWQLCFGVVLWATPSWGCAQRSVAGDGDLLSGLRDSGSGTFDYRVLKWLQDGRTDGQDRYWVMVSNSIAVAPAVPLGYALGGVLERDDLQRRGLLYANALESLGGYVLCLGVTMGVKSLVQRPRPWVAYAGDLTCLQPVRSYSFPSGHTSSVFAMATSVALMQPQWYVVVPAYMWAGAVAFSRLYVGAHYPTDVIAGAAVGVGCALLAHAVRGCLFRGQQETPPPDMVLLPLTFRF